MPLSIEVSKKTSMKMFRTALGTTVLAIAITIPFTVPAGAANAVVSSFAKQLVVAAAQAKPAHYVTNVDLNRAAPGHSPKYWGLRDLRASGAGPDRLLVADRKTLSVGFDTAVDLSVPEMWELSH